MFVQLDNLEAPVFPRRELRMLLENAQGIEPLPPAELELDLIAIGHWYLLPQARMAADADLDATRKYLHFLQRKGKPAFEALHHILCLLPRTIEEEIAADGTFRCSNAGMAADDVKDFLVDLERLLPRLVEKVSARRRGRRSSFVLTHSVRLAAQSLALAGAPVFAHHHTVLKPQPYLTGGGADVFLAFFKLLDPRLDERALAQALLRQGSQQD